MAESTRYRAHPHDTIVVPGHRVGDGRREGEIVEVLGEPENEHYRVRWDDGRESLFYPGDAAHIVPRDRD